MSRLDKHNTINDWVKEKMIRTEVFRELDIDSCCGGEQTLQDACLEKGLDSDVVMERLSRIDDEKADCHTTDWTSLPLQELVDHIESTHHAFLRRAIPSLSGLVEKVAQVHGERHPTLIQLKSTVSELFSDLQSHLMKEEQVLFPMIRNMNGEAPAGEFSCSGGFQGPLSVMRYEHDVAKRLLEKINRLTDNYKMPSDGCETYRQMLDGLKEFELDLHTHIHKENEVLFPGVQDLG